MLRQGPLLRGAALLLRNAAAFSSGRVGKLRPAHQTDLKGPGKRPPPPGWIADFIVRPSWGLAGRRVCVSTVPAWAQAAQLNDVPYDRGTVRSRQFLGHVQRKAAGPQDRLQWVGGGGVPCRENGLPSTTAPGSHRGR